MFLGDFLKMSATEGLKRPQTQAAKEAKIVLTGSIKEDKIHKLANQSQKHRTELVELLKSPSIIADLSSGALSTKQLAEHPVLTEILLHRDYLERVTDQASLTLFLCAALKQSSQPQAAEITRIFLASAAQHTLPPALLARLHDTCSQTAGPQEYMRAYEANIAAQTMMPAGGALDSLPALSFVSVGSQLLKTLSSNRSKSLAGFGQGSFRQARLESGSKPPRSFNAVALQLVRQARQDPRLAAEVSSVLDTYFQTVGPASLSHLEELELADVLSADLLFEYYFVLHQRVSYAERAVYLDCASVKKFLDLMSKFGGSAGHKHLGGQLIKERLADGRSRDADSLGFEYRLLPAEVAGLVRRFSLNEFSKQNVTVGSVLALLAAKSGAQAELCHLVEHHKLTPEVAPAAFDCLARPLVAANAANAEPVLLRLAEAIKLNGVTELGGLLEGVAVPVLKGQFEKAWKAAFTSVVLPAQRDIMTGLLLDMLQANYDSHFMLPAGNVYQRDRLRHVWAEYLATEVTPTQWAAAYDWYFAANRRDQLRADEAEQTRLSDADFFGGAFEEQAYHAHAVITKAFKALKAEQLKDRKAELAQRRQEQLASRRNRTEGFLRGANLPQLDKKEEEDKPADDADKQEAQPAGDEQQADAAKKKKKTGRSHAQLGDDKDDRIESYFEFEDPMTVNPYARFYLPNKVAISGLVRPNFNSWMTTLLARTTAPDELGTSSQIRYSERKADAVHALLELALDLQHMPLLALAEKCCGLFAQRLPLALRQKYKAFKEQTLPRDAALAGQYSRALESTPGFVDLSFVNRGFERAEPLRLPKAFGLAAHLRWMADTQLDEVTNAFNAYTGKTEIDLTSALLPLAERHEELNALARLHLKRLRSRDADAEAVIAAPEADVDAAGEGETAKQQM